MLCTTTALAGRWFPCGEASAPAADTRMNNMNNR
jgi:hypothetical protein